MIDACFNFVGTVADPGAPYFWLIGLSFYILAVRRASEERPLSVSAHGLVLMVSLIPAINAVCLLFESLAWIEDNR